jgi:AcrR family transcriptional regulator
MPRPKANTDASGDLDKSARDRLLSAAGELLSEMGMERISTNMICQRAGLSPPALYHYFSDKYDVVVALGEKLMETQNVALEAWVDRHSGGGIEAYADNIEELLRETAEITEAEPGGVWLERALHSTPKLEHVRIQSHQLVTEILTAAFHPLAPGQPLERVARRVRFVVEIGYSAVEMLHSEPNMARNDILVEAAHIIRIAMLDLRN